MTLDFLGLSILRGPFLLGDLHKVGYGLDDLTQDPWFSLGVFDMNGLNGISTTPKPHEEYQPKHRKTIIIIIIIINHH